jgi:hypothetical protein
MKKIWLYTLSRNLWKLKNWAKRQAKEKRWSWQESDKACFNCRTSGHFYRWLKSDEKKKCPAHGKTWGKCGKENHFEKVCRTKTEGALEAEEDEQGFLGCFGILVLASKYAKKARQKVKNTEKIMGHMEYDSVREEYVSSRMSKNHLLDVNITLDKSQYFQLGGTDKKTTDQTVKTEAVADTGAAVCCAPTSEIGNYGLRKADLFAADRRNLKADLFAADRRKLKIVGCIPVHYGKKQGVKRTLINLAIP